MNLPSVLFISFYLVFSANALFTSEAPKVCDQKQPVLILVGGFQGSGKSTLISRINETYKINIVSTDAIRQSLCDSGIKVSPEFEKRVDEIYEELIEKYLSNNSSIIIDANAHAKRIENIENLVKEKNSRHLLIKIFLNASEEVLKDRIKNRKSIEGIYQGTLSELEESLSTVEIDFNDYDLILDAENMSKDDVFESVNDFIFSYIGK